MKIARKDKVNARGIIYLLDIWVEEGLITPATAIGKLNLLVECGSRLPAKGCKDFIDKWSLM